MLLLCFAHQHKGVLLKLSEVKMAALLVLKQQQQ